MKEWQQDMTFMHRHERVQKDTEMAQKYMHGEHRYENECREGKSGNG